MSIKTAYFEITNLCNLNCITCYNRSGLNKSRQEISVAQLRLSIDAFLSLGLQRVLISGGEPTLYSDFGNVLALLQDYPDLSFGIITNGTVYNKELINLVNSDSRFTLQVSLDGSCEEQNAKTRGSGNFAKTIAFANMICQENPKPLLKMVISKNNLDDIMPFFHLALSLGFLPEFAFIYMSGNGCDGWEQKALSAQQKLSVLRLVDSLNEKQSVNALLPLCTDTCPYVSDEDGMSICIKSDGSIQPCQTMYNARFSLGNIIDLDLSAFMNKINDFRHLAKRRSQSYSSCNKCLLRENCGKGCMAAAVNMCGDPLGDDGDCEFRRLQFLGHNLKIRNF